MHDVRRRLPSPPRALLVAHGTVSPEGSATTARLSEAVAAARPDVPVSLCFLDVAEPSLPQALAALQGPTVVVPVLLSTGYHVQSDIPAAVAAYDDAVVARHLGPHPLLAEAVADRLAEARGAAVPSAPSTVLVGTGSSRPEAAGELAVAAELLAARLGRAVSPLGMTEAVRPALERVAGPIDIGTYLLAEGRFFTALREAADGLGTVGDPIGVHPALVRLVWQRYDDACTA